VERCLLVIVELVSIAARTKMLWITYRSRRWLKLPPWFRRLSRSVVPSSELVLGWRRKSEIEISAKSCECDIV